MSIQDLIDQFEIQGRYIIKTWEEEVCDCVTLARGYDFECEKYDIDEKIRDRKITYMYAIDDALNIEVE